MLYLLHNAKNNIVDTGGRLMNEQQVGELNSALGGPGIWYCAMPLLLVSRLLPKIAWTQSNAPSRWHSFNKGLRSCRRSANVFSI